MPFQVLDLNGNRKETPGVLTPANLYTEFTVTTTGNIDDLDFSNAATIRMNNASLATIRGLKAGVAGQHVTIVSIGAGEVDFAHQNAGSAAANRLINTVTSGVTPLVPGVGTAIYEYDATTGQWRLVSHTQGGWLTYSPSITPNTGTFTGVTVNPARYRILGSEMQLYLGITGTAGGSVIYFAMPVPSGYTFVALGILNTMYIGQNGSGSSEGGYAQAYSSPNVLAARFGNIAWGNGICTFYVYLSFPLS